MKLVDSRNCVADEPFYYGVLRNPCPTIARTRSGGSITPSPPFTRMFKTPTLRDHHLKVSKHGDAMVVRFAECHILDEFAVNVFDAELSGVADRDDIHRLILDFSGVNRLSSLMIHKIVMLSREMASKGGELVLCGLGPELQRLCSDAMFDQVLPIRGNVLDALEANPYRIAMRSP